MAEAKLPTQPYEQADTELLPRSKPHGSYRHDAPYGVPAET